ncbi:MAG: PhzF family phenazine biosynthesis protein [Pseudomonas sp.]
MTARRYLQLDVFSSAPGRGNPLGVVTQATDLDEARMQRLAAWLNLSETIFFLPPDAPGADYRIRIFTPKGELPFAGHPSVGAAWAAVELGLARPRDGALVQQCAAGLLPVRVHDDGSRRIELRSPTGRALGTPVANLPTELAAIVRPDAPPALWENGPAWWLIEARSAELVRGLRPDFSAIAAWTDTDAAVGVAVYAAEPRDTHQIVVRAFCPGDAANVPEDPVTGSANALIAARLAAEDRLPGRDGRYLASQGRELGRDGRVELTLDGDGEVWIGGQVQPVIDGRLDW